MDQEINAGYIITDRLAVGDTEFVIGQCDKVPARFVTWKCRKGEKSYFWGHYMTDQLAAVEDLCNRALDEIQQIRGFQQREDTAKKPPQKTRRKKYQPER